MEQWRMFWQASVFFVFFYQLEIVAIHHIHKLYYYESAAHYLLRLHGSRWRGAISKRCSVTDSHLPLASPDNRPLLSDISGKNIPPPLLRNIKSPSPCEASHFEIWHQWDQSQDTVAMEEHNSGDTSLFFCMFFFFFNILECSGSGIVVILEIFSPSSYDNNDFKDSLPRRHR